MTLILKKEDLARPWVILIITALCAQFLGRYFATKYFVIGNYFYSMWVILRIAIPVAVIALLKIPLNDLGLGLPKVDKTMRTVLIGASLLLIAAFAGIYFYQGYYSSYSGSFTSGAGDRAQRFMNFMIFTSSTLTGWEFIHRCFLLMGLSYLFTAREKIDPGTAGAIAVAIVWIFEVVFHFVKPPLEAGGLLIGSPLLSYLALRTGSIWPAFFMHLLVEVLFIASLIFR